MRPAPADVVLDTSAVMSLIVEEPEAEQVSSGLASFRRPLISAATVVELLLVAERRLGARGAELARQLLEQAEVVVIPVDEATAIEAHSAWQRFGKGNHPAALNYGDCFAYALARREELPLLCVGNDFRRTDLVLALA